MLSLAGDVSDETLASVSSNKETCLPNTIGPSFTGAMARMGEGARGRRNCKANTGSVAVESSFQLCLAITLHMWPALVVHQGL